MICDDCKVLLVLSDICNGRTDAGKNLKNIRGRFNTSCKKTRHPFIINEDTNIGRAREKVGDKWTVDLLPGIRSKTQ